MIARLTPYESILEPLERSTFPAIRAEAEQRGTNTRRRDQFLLLGHAGAALKEIVADEAPADAIDEYSELLYQGYQFWSFGRRLYVLDESVTEKVTQPTADLGSWMFAGPPSSYLQLPPQRLWSRVSVESPYEPVDGCFVVCDDTLPAEDAGAHLRVQLVLGMRSERPGVSLVSYRTDLDPRTAPEHAGSPWREDGPAFSNAIPGGERKGYRTVATTSELEALVIRILWHLDRNSRSLVAHDASAAAGGTRLKWVAVRG
ncbi:MAG: hypothetical protein M3068_05295 [Gemmatimonadota bacterium]|nr:hypothetical protein [Gemmatimonadota bacterium]